MSPATTTRIALLLVALVCVPATVRATAPDPPTFMLTWGGPMPGSGPGQLNFPTSVATDDLGNVYVLDTSNYRIEKFDRFGTFMLQCGGYGSANGQLYNPVGVAVDLAGNVFVADGGNARVQKFSPTGIYLGQWGSLGSAAGQFTGMGKLTIDAAGYVYVTDQGRVQKFTNAGVFVTQWGSVGSGNGQFNGPNAVATDAAGGVYVVDRLNMRVQKFSTSGAYVTQWALGGNTSDIVTDGVGDVYVCDDNAHVTRYSSTGTFEVQWGSSGSAAGQFNGAKGVEVDAEGNVYVADAFNNRVEKFSGSGAGLAAALPHQYLSQFGSSGGAPGQFGGPTGVAVDGSGNIYVSDLPNSRIQKFGPAGNFLLQWGSAGSGDGQFQSPIAIAVDGVGGVYVGDQNNHRVQKFTASGAFVTKWGTSGGGAGQFQQIQGIAADFLGNVYVTDLATNRVQKFTSTGTFVTQWGSFGSGAGQFNQAYGIAVDVFQNVCVVDSANDRVQEFTPAGAYITSWGSPGSSDGQFDTAQYLAVDATGDVYVTDLIRNNVQRFTAAGAFVARFGATGTGDGQLRTPYGVGIDPAGNVLVADTGNDRIQRFAAPPALAFVSDVRGDQGRAVRLRVLRSTADSPLSGSAITGYAVYRRQDAPFAAAGGATPAQRLASPDATALAGWDYVATIPARGDAEYAAIVPTLVDANATTRVYSRYFVSALTSNPYLYFDSPAESGYSVDNLSPGTPSPFLATYTAGTTYLHWGPSADADFATYRLYRGASADFTPNAGSLVATPADTGYADAGAAGRWYKLTAVDWNGNESPVAVLGPAQTTDAGGAPAALEFALEEPRPNPVTRERLEARLTLPDDAPARLALIDVTGRVVAEHAVRGAGAHAVRLSGGRALAPGVYLVRLTRGADVRVRRVVVVE